ncbi:MAG TPA: helix-turn-helix domain-containing protein [Chthoniobacterales bacterium]
MSIARRREREFRQREMLILDSAAVMLREHGYLGLNLDRLAESVEYSKGTLYQHFGTKEDIVLAIVARSLERRTQLFERAARFHGNSRERILAVGIADDVLSREESAHFQLVQMVKSRSIWEKTAPERRQAFLMLEERCFGILELLVREGISAGDLELPVVQGAEVAFGLMTMSLGTNLLVDAREWLEGIGLPQPRETLRVNQHRFLDGLGWKPLLKACDYAEAERRIWSEVFPNEQASFPPLP